MIRHRHLVAAVARCERCGRQLLWLPNGRGGWELTQHPDDCLSSKRWSGNATAIGVDVLHVPQRAPARPARLN